MSTSSAKSSFQDVAVEMCARYLLLEHLRTMERSFTGSLITRWKKKIVFFSNGTMKKMATLLTQLTQSRGAGAWIVEDFGRNNCRSLGSYFCNGDNSCFEDVNHFGLAFGRMFGLILVAHGSTMLKLARNYCFG
uniref:Uncharacterized protein n=1 Tax=Lactuca sativa TaxID=4236 RepID=A0A9R1VIB5_LACSA|nr:hypothetical protein LSAT_V11C500281920 [Lactuca sativa]